MAARRGRPPKGQRNKDFTTVDHTLVSSLGNSDKKVADAGVEPTAIHSLATQNGEIYEQIIEELKGQKGKIFRKQMAMDNTIAAPLDLLTMICTNVDFSFKIPKSSNKVEESRRDQLNYMISVMQRPFYEYISEAFTFLIHGFWVGEKLLTKDLKTPYGDMSYALSDIITISQETVTRWHFNKATGALEGLRQEQQVVLNDLQKDDDNHSHVDIPRKKFLHVRNRPKNNSPEGTSMLDSVVVPYKYKANLDYTLNVSAAKNISGVPMVGIDASKLLEAHNNPASAEARMIRGLEKMVQGIHMGERGGGTYPLAYNDAGKELYKFHLMGIDGTVNRQDLLGYIQHYSNQITLRFLSDIITLGSNGSGSFALADNKLALVRVACNNFLKSILSVFNHDLIPQLYRLNGWDYNPLVSCRLHHDAIKEFDLEQLGSFLQKASAVGVIRPTKDLEDFARNQLNLDPTGEDTEYLPSVLQEQSKSGQGMQQGTSDGAGNGQSGSKGDPNTAAVSK